MRRVLTIAIAVLLILAALAFIDNPRRFATLAAQSSGDSPWHAAAWPFATDAWPEGRAYHCDAAKCGATLDLYIRPKIGFCDCYRGVADDDEIDRVGDLALLNPNYSPSQPGVPVQLAGLDGRARLFILPASARVGPYAVGIALSRRCDAIVATLVSEQLISPAAKARAFELIDSAEIRNWIETLPQS
jgi:hypothetical protein